MKRLTFVVVAVAVMFSMLVMPAAANPPGTDDLGQKLWGFEMIARPNDWSQDDLACENNGSRIFFDRVSSGTIGYLTWKLDPAVNTWKILDCDGTDDAKGATVQVPESVAFTVAVRVVGKKTDSLGVVCHEVVASPDLVDLCIVDDVKVTINKDKAFTKIMTNIFDNQYEEVLWTLDTSTGFRHAQVRVYETP